MSAWNGEDEIGDITLCAHCGFAIQLRRIDIPGLGEHDVWEHFRVPITPHLGHSKRGLLDFTPDSGKYGSGVVS